MNKLFQEIWRKSEPYQDKRDDAGHARIVTQFAKELLETEAGDEDIVIPAAMLHDVGWSQISENQRMELFNSMPGSSLDTQLRLLHQVKGVELAKDILRLVGYPVELQNEVLEIIGKHDTREGYLNLNDGIMRDADKLWMFSPEGFNADLKRRKTTPQEEWIGYLSNLISDKKFYTKSAYQIAQRELGLRISERQRS